MVRNDIHCPKNITPADYEFVAWEIVKIQDFGDCAYLQAERQRIRDHMAKTGGTYSTHDHGGNCMVCGNANAIYTALFYHAKTNTYVRTGQDCADKMGFGTRDFNEFKKAVHDAKLAHAGKKKAAAILSDAGLSKAWDLYTADTVEQAKEEMTILDIVNRLVKYGDISEKALNYVGALLNRIANRAKIQAEREAEAAKAANCPTGRIDIEGVVLTIRVDDGQFGPTTKMLVKHDTGFKVWGTRPSALYGVKVGDRVLFTGTVQPSDKDSKFGFFSRPTGGKVIAPVAA